MTPRPSPVSGRLKTASKAAVSSLPFTVSLLCGVYIEAAKEDINKLDFPAIRSEDINIDREKGDFNEKSHRSIKNSGDVAELFKLDLF